MKRLYEEKSNLAFVSILYHPDDNALISIERAMRAGFNPVIYLNDVSDEYLAKLKSLNVTILGCNSNVGLGRAFFDIENYLIENGFFCYLYFDQDTVVADSAWEKIKSTYDYTDPDVGLIFYTSSDINRNDFVISSGCLFSLSVIKKVGFHDSSYFVEGVDYEFCLRLKISGYKIKINHIDGIDHNSLQDGVDIKLLGFDFRVRDYGLSRTVDFNRSQFKLFMLALNNKNYSSILFFIKSIFIFNVKEFVSKAILSFKVR
ncbi:MAG: hypothetical protein Q4A94_08955 [Plesiomonas sp.]|nr:hypothetical protein [Plesiomonas sp.]